MKISIKLKKRANVTSIKFAGHKITKKPQEIEVKAEHLKRLEGMDQWFDYEKSIIKKERVLNA